MSIFGWVFIVYKLVKSRVQMKFLELSTLKLNVLRFFELRQRLKFCILGIFNITQKSLKKSLNQIGGTILPFHNLYFSKPLSNSFYQMDLIKAIYL